MAEAAFDAFKRYGKGQGHKAQLNIIDCAAYALAKTRDLPLLFKRPTVGGLVGRTGLSSVKV